MALKPQKPIEHIVPGISEKHRKMVAEILACRDPDPARRSEHRKAKLQTFPAEHRAIVRDLANTVIKARAKKA